MKKFIALASIGLIIANLTSCNDSNNELQIETKEKVEVSLSYSFADSGSLTRSVGSDTYTKFYNALVKTKTITPDNYNLTFTEKNTGTTYTYKGKWSRNEKINILEGDYTVTGTSAPVTITIDTLYIAFNEDIKITKDIQSITLNANNDSYLLLFNATPLKSITYRYNSYVNNYISLNQKEGVFYMYVKELFKDGRYPGYGLLDLDYNNGNSGTLNISNTPFELGKYYYFNEVANSFNVPPMEEGN